LTLVCLPYAGGSAAAFAQWQPHLDPQIALVPASLPGRDARANEPPSRNLLELASRVADGLAATLTSPLVLFGHSMGGLLAFEVARELRRRNHPEPELLILSAVRSPERTTKHVPLHVLPEDELVRRLRSLGGIPEPFLAAPALLRSYLPALRADLEAYETYRYRTEPPLATPFLVLGGANDPLVQRTDLDAWGCHTSSGCRVRLVRGAHFFIHSARTGVLRLLDRELRSIRGHRASSAS
jgi:surfactin synthase thioesterase subunit